MQVQSWPLSTTPIYWHHQDKSSGFRCRLATLCFCLFGDLGVGLLFIYFCSLYVLFKCVFVSPIFSPLFFIFLFFISFYFFVLYFCFSSPSSFFSFFVHHITVFPQFSFFPPLLTSAGATTLKETLDPEKCNPFNANSAPEGHITPQRYTPRSQQAPASRLAPTLCLPKQQTTQEPRLPLAKA